MSCDLQDALPPMLVEEGAVHVLQRLHAGDAEKRNPGLREECQNTVVHFHP